MATFRAAIAAHGIPVSVARHRVIAEHSAPNHPQTCGKVERFHQTLKRRLRAQPDQPCSITELQTQLEHFAGRYNQHRPHRALNRRTPDTAYRARPKATPTDTTIAPDPRIRRDRIDTGGVVTLRYQGRLHHIGIGRPPRRH